MAYAPTSEEMNDALFGLSADTTPPLRPAEPGAYELTNAFQEADEQVVAAPSEYHPFTYHPYNYVLDVRKQREQAGDPDTLRHTLKAFLYLLVTVVKTKS